jgi:hypothetical protein
VPVRLFPSLARLGIPFARGVRARSQQHLCALVRSLSPVRAAVGITTQRLLATTLSRTAPLHSRYERPFQSATGSEFERQLQELASRIRWQRTWQHVPRAILFAAIVAVSFALLGRFLGTSALGVFGLLIGLVSGIATIVVVARRRVGPFEAARRTDAALALRERLSTALELLETAATGPLVQRQVHDALEVAKAVRPQEAFPVYTAASEQRRSALRTSGYGTVALAAAFALIIWPAATPVRARPPAEREFLALADTGRREEIARVDPYARPNADAIEGRTARPDELGEAAPGLLGPAENANSRQADAQGAQSGQGDQRGAQQDAQSQSSASAAQREAALQDLGNALRQTQTARQAGESLRAGDTERASQQLSQLADQSRNLSPGERQSLAQAFREASQQIGEKDPALSDAAQRAGDALGQFRSQEAQQAIRDAANQVRDSGRQAQAQRELAERAQQLQSGGQAQLPQQGQQGQAGDSRQQGDQASRGQQGQQGQSGGARSEGAGSDAASLAQLEAELRGGTMGGSGSGGAGAGSGAGANREGPPQRLNVDARTVTVNAEVGEGPNLWRLPSPNAVPGGPPPGPQVVPGGPISASPVGAGLDLNAVPYDLADPVRQYFTPEQPKP